MPDSSLSRVCPKCKTTFGRWFEKFRYCPICRTTRLISMEEFECDQAQAVLEKALFHDEEPWLFS